jgi:hypothetical protein
VSCSLFAPSLSSASEEALSEDVSMSSSARFFLVCRLSERSWATEDAVGSQCKPLDGKRGRKRTGRRCFLDINLTIGILFTFLCSLCIVRVLPFAQFRLNNPFLALQLRPHRERTLDAIVSAHLSLATCCDGDCRLVTTDRAGDAVSGEKASFAGGEEGG